MVGVVSDGRRVVLHIGPPKTGSTFLQGLLWGHRERLAREGVGIPGRGRGQHVHAGIDLRTVRAAPADPKQPPPRWEGAWDRLAAAARNSGHKTVVISDERLAGASAGDAQRAVASLAPAEVHVVYTARELLGLLPSAWQEQVKSRYTGGFDEWVNEVFDSGRDGEAGSWFWLVHDAGEVLRRWGSAVPAERIHVVTMPPSTAPPHLLWERFASLLGIDPGCLDASADRTNSSLSLEQTELLRRVNTVLGPHLSDRSYFAVVGRVFAREILPSQHPSRIRPRIPPQVVERSAAHTERILTELTDAGYHIVGDLADLRATASDTAPERDDPELDTGDVLDAAVHAAAGLLEHLDGMLTQQAATRQQIARLRRRLRRARSQHDEAPTSPSSSRIRRDGKQILKEAPVALAGGGRIAELARRAYRATRSRRAGIIARR